ncbi:MAG: hypothetical protein GF353_20450 [Candidatus Lokiarchaeota archaeon]|nr:hypothetical protein [Candidatus Lokiarchaeota archaeon]
MDISKETELLTRENLSIIRNKKLKDEIQAAIRLLKKKVEPLEIADKFIHNTFELMKDGILCNFPKLTKAEVLQRFKDKLYLTKKVKSLRKRVKNFG